MRYEIAEMVRWAGFLTACVGALPIFLLVVIALAIYWPITLIGFVLTLFGVGIFWAGETIAPYDGR